MTYYYNIHYAILTFLKITMEKFIQILTLYLFYLTRKSASDCSFVTNFRVSARLIDTLMLYFFFRLASRICFMQQLIQQLADQFFLNKSSSFLYVLQ